MSASKSAITFFLSCLLLLSPMATAQNAKYFTEYIGALYNGVQFTNVPINSSVDFHFILAFTIDYDSSTVATNGQFDIYWQNTVLTASAISSVKASNPNVKVGLSLGGDSINSSPVVFSATSVDSWVANAVSSLTSIIHEYGIDGIDIDYEHFSDGDTDTFVQCIGQLITTLKNNGVISFASIAPFDNSDVQTRYQALWEQYSSVIDFVNFQFYAYSSDTTQDQFLSYYNTQLSNYSGGKVLVSFTTATNGGGLSPANGFFDACSTLQSENELTGIFVWSADDSYANGSFQYETQAQQLLANA